MNMIHEIARTRDGRAQVMRLLEEFGIERTDENLEQLLVFLEAVAIYDERTHLYRDQWRSSGAIDNLRNARRKVLRQLTVTTTVAANTTPVLTGGNEDDAIDTLNYVAFFVRNFRAINFDGNWGKDG